jgi:hypothetical protein
VKAVVNLVKCVVAKEKVMKKTVIAGVLTLFALPVFAQKAFTTPEKAATALVEAITTHNEAKMSALLGDDWRRYLPPEGADPEAVARFLRDWKESHKIVTEGDTAYINVGSENWQLPIPMTRHTEGWQFNMAQAAEEIETREIGRNELSAIQAMHAFVDAQQEYYQLTNSWAKKLISSEGKKDGLYWPIKPGEAPSPLGPAYSPAVPGMGYHGYHFRIINDHDASGVALIAWPVVWGQTGVMSFMVNLNDEVYQADLGEQSAEKAKTVTHFSTEAPWQKVEQ